MLTGKVMESIREIASKVVKLKTKQEAKKPVVVTQPGPTTPAPDSRKTTVSNALIRIAEIDGLGLHVGSEVRENILKIEEYLDKESYAEAKAEASRLLIILNENQIIDDFSRMAANNAIGVAFEFNNEDTANEYYRAALGALQRVQSLIDSQKDFLYPKINSNVERTAKQETISTPAGEILKEALDAYDSIDYVSAFLKFSQVKEDELNEIEKSKYGLLRNKLEEIKKTETLQQRIDREVAIAKIVNRDNPPDNNALNEIKINVIKGFYKERFNIEVIIPIDKTGEDPYADVEKDFGLSSNTVGKTNTFVKLSNKEIEEVIAKLIKIS